MSCPPGRPQRRRPRRPAPPRALAALALAALLAGGCGEGPPPDQVYSLPLTDADRQLPVAPIEGALMVDTFRADAVLVNRRIAWRESPESLRIQTYDNQLWSAQPPRLIQSHLHNCLGNANVADRVVLPTDRADIDVILGGDILAFEQQLTGPASARVAVTLDLRLSSRRTRDLIWQRRVSVSAPAASAAPEDAAPALADALDRLCGEIVRVIPPAPGSGARPDAG